MKPKMRVVPISQLFSMRKTRTKARNVGANSSKNLLKSTVLGAQSSWTGIIV